MPRNEGGEEGVSPDTSMCVSLVLNLRLVKRRPA